MTEPWAPGSPIIATTSANPRGRSPLHELNGGGGVVAAALRAADDEHAETDRNLVHAVRREERRRMAEELVKEIADMKTRMGHVEKVTAISLIREVAEKDVE